MSFPTHGPLPGESDLVNAELAKAGTAGTVRYSFKPRQAGKALDSFKARVTRLMEIWTQEYLDLHKGLDPSQARQFAATRYMETIRRPCREAQLDGPMPSLVDVVDSRGPHA